MVSLNAVQLIRRARLVAIAWALLAGSAAARFTLEQVMSAPFPSELVVAEHSGRIAWVFAARGVRNVWVADAPDFRARQVTHYRSDDGQAISSPRLTPDGRTVVYVRGSETNREGEVANPTSSVTEPHQQVWAVDVDGGEPRLLGTMEVSGEGDEDVQISPDGRFAVWAARNKLWLAPVSGAAPARELAYVRGENDSPRWSPDGRRIAFVSDRGDHSFIAIYDFGRDSISYLAPSVDRDIHPRWSPDGRQIAFIRRRGTQAKMPIIPLRADPWSIWVGDPETGKAREIWRSGEQLEQSLPNLTAGESFHFAAGNRIVFAYEQDGWNHLYSVPATGGQAALLTPGNFEVEHVSLSADKRSVLYSSNQDDIDRRHLWRVSVEGGVPQALTRGETIEWSPRETGDGKFVVFLGSDATSPAMPYYLGGKGRTMIAREALPGDFPSAELVVPRQVVFKAEDGVEIHGQLFEPKGASGKLPALIFIHGGSRRQMVLGFHYMYYYSNAYQANQYLASQGYVVLSVNYRTGIMYGRNFREVKDGGWRGASEYKDIVAAGRYLQSLPNVDPKRIGSWGGSYGGYLTAMALARNSDIFAAGVDLHGVHDWSAFMTRFTRNIAGSPPDEAEARKLAFQSSPNSSIATWKSPVLLIHGDDDRNVAFSQTVDLAQRLREQKVPFEQIIYPDEIHDFLLWRSWVRAYAAMADFFDRTLKRGEAVGAKVY